MVVTPEDSVRIGSLLAGQADYIRYVQAFDEAQVSRAGFELVAPQTRGVNNSLGLRFTNPLLSDIRVRQALVPASTRRRSWTRSSPRTTRSPRRSSQSTANGYKDESEGLRTTPKLGRAARRGRLDGRRRRHPREGRRARSRSRSTRPSRSRSRSRRSSSWRSSSKKIGVELNVKSADAGTYAEDIKDPLKTPLYHSMVGRADST